MSLLAKCLRISLNNTRIQTPVISSFLTLDQTRNYAARKGTREKARKKKVKKEEVKVGFIPHNQRDLDKIVRPKKKFDDSWKIVSTDNVWPARYYQWKVYPFVEAVQSHRETHDPTMYNEPNAPLRVIIELNMQGEKPTRFVDTFHRMAPMPHKFDHGEERSILAFAKDQKSLDEALKAGASLTGGPEIVKEIQTGKISLQDFQHVVAHPNILPELVCLRGLMKRKFPNPKNGTLSVDLGTAVDKFVNGINYSGIRDEWEKDFGSVETIIGTLDMDPKHLEENFESLVKDVYQMRPKRAGVFISRCLLMSPPSSEKLKVDYLLYVDEKAKGNEEDEEDEGEQEERKEAAV